MEKNTELSKQNVKHKPIDPAIPLLGIYTEDIFIKYTKICNNNLLLWEENWQSKYPSKIYNCIFIQ